MDRKITVTTTREITRLVFECSWKDRAEFKCAVCYTRCNAGENSERSYSEAWQIARNEIVEHITSHHPAYCDSCDNCKKLFITKKDLKAHSKICQK
jgi:hypothetical protein